MENFTLVKGEWSQHKERLKASIDHIGKSADDPNLYDSIDKACSNEQAFLFLSRDGFFVLRPRYRRGSTFVELSVAHCQGGNGIIRYQPHIITLARKGKAKFIEFLTARKGLDRVAPRHGWIKHGYHQHLAIWRYTL
ncbi:hypothetical protein HWQ46_01665 [Shewanella sp. D64]|uniref:hypothetical protein n=1 Tax=unclassified Shewanella TaxID=196818 RepID=UPI0022BA694C|nr:MULTISPECIES: hypothetical protein [unclassified Shewanella]MEC4724254.1 hypothetical protein [Shewanella sp. D64]MEC4738766.1 hypothetical protein [Shewanella sp. E94]WBJ97794.1 hypothetical protein HWQ47_12190 [Shewanella sp. MTB7]